MHGQQNIKIQVKNKFKMFAYTLTRFSYNEQCLSQIAFTETTGHMYNSSLYNSVPRKHTNNILPSFCFLVSSPVSY